MSNTRAVLEAVGRRRTPFVRTPKAGDRGGWTSYAPPPERLVVWAERAMAAYSLAGLVALVVVEAWAGVGFQALFAVGFGLLGFFDAARVERQALPVRPVRPVPRPVEVRPTAQAA